MMLKEYFGLTDDKAFSGLVIAGFTAIMVGAVFLIISLLVVNSVSTATGAILGTLNATQTSVLASVGQALQIGGVALIIVGVAVIIAVLLGMTGGGRR